MNILELIESNDELLIKHRRHLHAHPELSGQEIETIAYIKQELDNLNIAYKQVEGGGVLAFIKGKRSGKRILLRADIDALPLTEIKNERNACYISQNVGVMHACGHDAHTAMLLVAAKVINEIKDEFDGEVVCCFEQGEEGTYNIRYLLKYFETEKMRFDCCFGMHVSPYMEKGKMMIQKGEVMAGIGRFHVTLKGKGGHGSRPDLSINPIDTFASIYGELNQVRSTMMDPYKPFTMSFGHIEAGKAANVIPETLHFRGTYRFFDLNDGLFFRKKLKEIVEAHASYRGIEVDFEALPFPSYPLINHPEVTELCKVALSEFKDDFMEEKPWMGSESFPYYQLQTPGVFIFLGIENKEKGIMASIHNPAFDLDEDALSRGVYGHVMMALTFLNGQHTFSTACHEEDVSAIFEKLGYQI